MTSDALNGVQNAIANALAPTLSSLRAFLDARHRFVSLSFMAEERLTAEQRDPGLLAIVEEEGAEG